MKTVKRDEKGEVKLGFWQRWKSKRLASQIRKGKLPRGRVISAEEAIDSLRMGAPKNALEVLGFLSAIHIKADGSTIDRGLVSCEKITAAFRDYIVDALQDSATYPMDSFKYHASGTGSTAEANTQTALVTEVATRSIGTQIEGASANIFRTVATITYSGAFSIQEHAVLSAATVGTMMDRSVFSTISVTSGDSIQFTYEATFNAEA
jgi:hypothetical protein